VTVDDMRNVNVYLFDRVHAELKELQAEVNYRAMKQRGEKVQMNKELFNAIYRVAARHEDEILAEQSWIHRDKSPVTVTVPTITRYAEQYQGIRHG